MVQRRSRSRFAQKALAIGGVRNHVLRKELQRNRALQLSIQRAIHHAHAPSPSQAEDFVITDNISRRQSGSIVRHRVPPPGDQPQANQPLSARSSIQLQRLIRVLTG
jgi:hypothetical protein